MIFEKRLERNIGAYLERRTARRPILKEVIADIISTLPDTVIFGGMIREFALGNARSFVSDIDLVSTAPQIDIFMAVGKYQAVRNKFGGFRFVVEKQRFDIWSLSDTWAFNNGFAAGKNFTDLLTTSFFNIDAACYHVKRKRLLCLPDYSQWLHEKVLDINLLQNPHPAAMARRALSLIHTRQLGITRRLAEYIIYQIGNEPLSWIEQILIGDITNYLASDSQDVFYFSPQIELGKR
jgi:hypothetical protein